VSEWRGEGAATMTKRPWMELESGHVKSPSPSNSERGK